MSIYCKLCGKPLYRTEIVEGYDTFSGKPLHYWRCPDFMESKFLFFHDTNGHIGYLSGAKVKRWAAEGLL